MRCSGWRWLLQPSGRLADVNHQTHVDLALQSSHVDTFVHAHRLMHGAPCAGRSLVHLSPPLAGPACLTSTLCDVLGSLVVILCARHCIQLVGRGHHQGVLVAPAAHGREAVGHEAGLHHLRVLLGQRVGHVHR